MDTRLLCGSWDGTHMKGVSLELKLGHKVSERRDLTNIKFNK
jgi:hypothetical protein